MSTSFTDTMQTILWMAAKYAEVDPTYRDVIDHAILELRTQNIPVYSIRHYQYVNSGRIGLSHTQRQERRREIAQYKWENPDATLEHISQLFNVSQSTTIAAIKQHETTIFISTPVTTDTSTATDISTDKQLYFWWYNCHNYPQNKFNIINDMMHGIGISDVARKYNLTRQRIHQIKVAAEQKGVIFPLNPRSKNKPNEGCVVCGMLHQRVGITCSKECFRTLVRTNRITNAQQANYKWSRLITNTFSCVGCGSLFDRTNYQVAIAELQGGSPKYCSKECYYNRTMPRDATAEQDETEATRSNIALYDENEAPCVIKCSVCDNEFEDNGNIGICRQCVDELGVWHQALKLYQEANTDPD